MNFFNKKFKRELDNLKQDQMKPYIKESDILPANGQWEDREQQKQIQQIQAKKILSRTGFSLFCMAAAVLGTQMLIDFLTSRLCPWVTKTNWYVWAVTAISIIGIGFPVYYLLIRKIPDSPRGEIVRISPLKFAVLFIICCSAMYITNLLSGFLTILIALLKGDKELINPVEQAMLNSNIVLSMIYASLVAPVIEELTFRKLLLEKLRRFGDIPAMLMSGIAFGLFHMNLNQFFYAAVLGSIFAYITLKTNTVRYAILLHMIVNFIGAMATFFVTGKNTIGIIMLYQWMLCSIILGIILFVLNCKRISFDKGLVSLSKKSDYIKNTGTILYIAICLVMIVIMTIVPAR